MAKALPVLLRFGPNVRGTQRCGRTPREAGLTSALGRRGVWCRHKAHAPFDPFGRRKLIARVVHTGLKHVAVGVDMVLDFVPLHVRGVDVGFGPALICAHRLGLVGLGTHVPPRGTIPVVGTHRAAPALFAAAVRVEVVAERAWPASSLALSRLLVQVCILADAGHVMAVVGNPDVEIFQQNDGLRYHARRRPPVWHILAANRAPCPCLNILAMSRMY